MDALCPRCGLAVYAAEVCPTSGGTYHPLCLSCLHCKKVLSTTTAVTSTSTGQIYCTHCYQYRVLASHNHPLGSGKTTSILARPGDPAQCPKCLGKVFQAEQMLSAIGVYHKACFRCAEAECGRTLDSTSYCDSPQGIFCNTCYKKLFGLGGCGYGKEGEEQHLPRIVTPGSSTPSYSSSAAPKCPSCLCPVFAAERVYVGTRQWHKTCLACSTCSRLLDSTSLNDVGGGLTIYCNKCYRLANTRSGARARV